MSAAVKKYLHDMDLSRNQILNLAIHNRVSPPDTPVSGQIYFNTIDTRIYFWDGTDWVDISGDLRSVFGGSGLTATYSTNGDEVILDVNVDNVTIEIDADTLRIKDLGVTSAKIADSAVTTVKISSNAVTLGKIQQISALRVLGNMSSVSANVSEVSVVTDLDNATSGSLASSSAVKTYVDIALVTKADLVGGFVPSSQLPSYVDDVLEYANQAAFPLTGETGKIYVALDNNRVFRWTGSTYIEISPVTGIAGTVNYVAKFTGASSLGNSLIFDNGTNVGIGTVTPQKTLSVVGGFSFGDQAGSPQSEFSIYHNAAAAILSLRNATATQSAGLNLRSNSGTLVFTMFGTTENSQGYQGLGTVNIGANDFVIFSTTTGSTPIARFFTGGNVSIGSNNNTYRLDITGTLRNTTDAYLATNSGNVGIGTTSPGVNLDVVGTGSGIVRIKGGSAANQGAAYYIREAATNNTFFAIGDSAAVIGGAVDTLAVIYTRVAPLSLYLNGSERHRFHANSNVTIGGTTDSGYRFDVTGTLRTTSSAYLATSSGGVGIGKTSVTTNYLLDVAGSVLLDTNGTGGQLAINAYGVLAGRIRTPFDGTAYKWLAIDVVSGGSLLFTGNTTEWARFNSSGNFGIGTTSPLALLHVGNRNSTGSTDPLILASRTINSGTGNSRGFSDSTNYARSGGTSYASYDARIDMTGTNDFGHYAAFQSGPTLNFTGAITDVFNYISSPTYTSGTITNSYGTYVQNPVKTGATLTNNYGHYIPSVFNAGTNNWVWYNASTARSYSAGDTISRKFYAGSNSVAVPDAQFHAEGTGDVMIRIQQTGWNFWDFKSVSSQTYLTIGDVSGTYATFFNLGNVALGTTTNNGYKLDVQGSFRNTTSAYFATSSGGVGIGITSIAPQAALEVKGQVWVSESTRVQYLSIVPTLTENTIYSNYTGGGSDKPIIIGTFANRTNQLYLATSGSVGIGTTSPAATLDVRGNAEVTNSSANAYFKITSAAINSPYISYVRGASQTWWVGSGIDASNNFSWYDLTGTSYRMLLTTAGNLGLGTTSPAAIFHVQTSATEVGRFVSTNSLGPYLVMSYGATPTTNAIIGAYPAASGGGVNFAITDFMIRAQGHMIFSAGGATERMVLFQNGNLALGTVTDNGYKLDVNGTLRATGTITGSNYFISTNGVITTSSSTGNFILFGGGTHQGGRIDLQGGSAASNPGTLLFSTGLTGTAVERMRINAGGNVSIGNFNDTYKLDVSGQIRSIVSVATAGYQSGIILTDTTTTTLGFGLQSTSGASLPFVYGNSGLGFGTNLSERMRITSAGRLLVGTTTESTYLLDVAGDVQVQSSTGSTTVLRLIQHGVRAWSIRNTATNGHFDIFDGSQSGLFIQGGGIYNVGIGTTSPASKLNVLTTKTFALSTAADFLTLGLTIDDNNNYDNVGVGGGIAFRGKYNSGGTQVVFGAIDAGKEFINNVDWRGSLRFYTNNNATGIPTERMRLTSDGNIGIGTSSPISEVHVQQGLVTLSTANLANGTVTAMQLTYPDLTLSGGEGIAIALGMNGRGRSYIANLHTTTNKDATDLVFYTTTGAVINERLRINELGNVGIGTSSPSVRTHIEINVGSDSELLRLTNINALGGSAIRIDRTSNLRHSAVLFSTGLSTNWHLGILRNGGSPTNSFAIGTGGDINATAPMLFLDGTNIGIGTTSPSYKLHVNGAMYAQGDGTDVSMYLPSGRAIRSTGTIYLDVASGGTGDLFVRANANNAINVKANTNVIVGGTTDVGYKLDVQGTLRNTTSAFFATSSGNVAIGSTSGNGKLFVVDDVNGDVNINFQNNNAGTSARIRLGFASQAGTWYLSHARTGGSFSIFNESSEFVTITRTSGYFGINNTNPTAKFDVVSDITTMASFSGPTGTDVVRFTNTGGNGNSQAVQMEFRFNSTAAALYNGALIYALKDAGVNTTNLQFHTTPAGSTTPVERMRIVGDGKVSIGPNLPTYDLTVNGSGDKAFGIVPTSGGASLFLGSTIGYDRIIIGSGTQAMMIGGWPHSGNMQFHTTSGGVTSERMRITAAGNVGIGVTSPTWPLDVMGGTGNVTVARFRGNSAANNNVQIRFFGANAAADLYAVGNAVATGDATRNFDIYDLVADTNRLRIDSSGNIGIGTTSPVNNGAGWTSLTINGSSYGSMYFQNGGLNRAVMYHDGSGFILASVTGNLQLGAGNAERMRLIGANGNFIIGGTTDAGYKLDVQGTLRNTTSSYFATSSGSVGIGNTNPLELLQVGAFTGSNTVLIGADPTSGFSSVYFGDGTGTDRYSGYLQYEHANDAMVIGTNKTEKVRVTSAGNMGIGITPTAQLHVASNIGAIRKSNATNTLYLEMTNDGIYSVGGPLTLFAPTSQALILASGNGEAARFTSDKNFLIGQTSDTGERLQVNGSIKTASPTGGTAAAWKFGAVATVTPTSPNRTIEVEIGGTTYYLTAKTTNN